MVPGTVWQRDCDNDKKIASGPLAGQPCKNDSAMWDTYNTYSNGHGGCCAAWSGDQSPYGPMGNYFCGNASAGGWVGFNDPRGMPGSSGINGTLDNGQPAGYRHTRTQAHTHTHTLTHSHTRGQVQWLARPVGPAALGVQL